MVINQSVMRAAQIVGAALELPVQPGGAAPGEGEPVQERQAPNIVEVVAPLASAGDPEWLQLWRERQGRLAVPLVALLLLVSMLVLRTGWSYVLDSSTGCVWVTFFSRSVS